jgi:hypothetical protein
VLQRVQMHPRAGDTGGQQLPAEDEGIGRGICLAVAHGTWKYEVHVHVDQAR